MKHTRTRFDWIALSWIAIGYFEWLFLLLYHFLLLFLDGNDHIIALHFCGIAGQLSCLYLIVLGGRVIDRKWQNLTFPSIFGIVWGIIHGSVAIAWMRILFLKNTPPPEAACFILLGFSAAGFFLILSSLYFIMSPGIYLQDRSRRLASRASHGASEAQPAS